MPLPLLFIIPAVAGGVVGAGKTIKAVVDNSEAKDVNSRANRVVEQAKRKIEFAKDRSGKSLENLGAKKIDVLNNDIVPFVESFEKLKNVELSNSVGLEELGKFKIDKAALEELREMGSLASSFAGGVAGVVLGGAPALLVLGFVVGAKASKNLDNAYSNLSEARKFENEMEVAAVACNGIRRRAYMFYRLLVRIDAIFAPLILQMQNIIEKSGVDFSAYTDDEKHTIAAAASMAGSVKAILDTAILTEDGKLTEESAKIANEVKTAIESQ